MRRRTRAREAAIQFLYQIDLRGESVEGELQGFLDDTFSGADPDEQETELADLPLEDEDDQEDQDPAEADSELESAPIKAAPTAQELAAEDAKAFTRRLVLGTRRATTEIDATLRRVAHNWDLQRMAAIDRNVLRMAVYELLHCSDIPPKVTINEAIELGKKFSTANSGGFINGILDRIRIDHSKTAEPAATRARQAEAGQASLGSES